MSITVNLTLSSSHVCEYVGRHPSKKMNKCKEQKILKNDADDDNNKIFQ